MSLADVAPVSAIASVTARSTSGGVGRRRQIRFEHGDLGGLLVDEILPSALQELLDGIAPLLHERLHHLARLAVVERAPFLDLAIHERGLQHAQRAQARRVLAAHGVRDRRAYVVSKGHREYARSLSLLRLCDDAWLALSRRLWRRGDHAGTATPAGALTDDVGAGAVRRIGPLWSSLRERVEDGRARILDGGIRGRPFRRVIVVVRSGLLNGELARLRRRERPRLPQAERSRLEERSSPAHSCGRIRMRSYRDAFGVSARRGASTISAGRAQQDFERFDFRDVRQFERHRAAADPFGVDDLASVRPWPTRPESGRPSRSSPTP